jgi:hypothetical protein
MDVIVVDGKPSFRTWNGEIADVDPRSYRRGGLSDLWLPLREKRWQYVGIYTEELVIGLAVVHASYIGNLFCYVYDRATGVLWEQERIAPAAAGIRVDRNIAKGVVSYTAESERVRIDNDTNAGIRSVDLRLSAEGRDLDMRLEIQDDLKALRPLQVVTPTAAGDFTFTHKAAGLPVLGSVRLGDRKWELRPETSLCAIDFSFGYPARETRWNWASMAGRSDDGRVVGLNLVDPVFHPEHNENALWIGGEMVKAGAARFEYSKEDSLQPWHISTEDGVDLRFTPLGKREQDIDYIVLSSRFQQPFGTFEGTLPDGKGGTVTVTGQPGVVEEHFARW